MRRTMTDVFLYQIKLHSKSLLSRTWHFSWQNQWTGVNPQPSSSVVFNDYVFPVLMTFISSQSEVSDIITKSFCSFFQVLSSDILFDQSFFKSQRFAVNSTLFALKTKQMNIMVNPHTDRHIWVVRPWNLKSVRSFQQTDRSQRLNGLAVILSFRIYSQAPLALGFDLRELVFLFTRLN